MLRSQSRIVARVLRALRCLEYLQAGGTCRASGALLHVCRVRDPRACRRALLLSAMKEGACATVVDPQTRGRARGRVAAIRYSKTLAFENPSVAAHPEAQPTDKPTRMQQSGEVPRMLQTSRRMQSVRDRAAGATFRAYAFSSQVALPVLVLPSPASRDSPFPLLTLSLV